jgi:hypothetical protein
LSILIHDLPGDLHLMLEGVLIFGFRLHDESPDATGFLGSDNVTERAVPTQAGTAQIWSETEAFTPLRPP